MRTEKFTSQSSKYLKKHVEFGRELPDGVEGVRTD
jgi:hypothetical protein